MEQCSGTSQGCRSANNGSGLWGEALALHRRIITGHAGQTIYGEEGIDSSREIIYFIWSGKQDKVPCPSDAQWPCLRWGMGRLHALCFWYHARSFTYSDMAASWEIVLIVCLVLHFLISLRHNIIICVMSLDSGGLSSEPSGENNARTASISGFCNGIDRCSESVVRPGSVYSAI